MLDFPAPKRTSKGGFCNTAMRAITRMMRIRSWTIRIQHQQIVLDVKSRVHNRSGFRDADWRALSYIEVMLLQGVVDLEIVGW